MTEWRGHAEEADRLEAALGALRGRRRRAKRLSSLCYLGAGLLLGTGLYLARVRLASLVALGRGWIFAAVVGGFVALFVVATRLERRVGLLDDERRALEERIIALRRLAR